MNAEELMTGLTMCAAPEAPKKIEQLRPEVVIDLRAEAPVTEESVSFSLANGGPTDPQELKRAIEYTAEVLQNGNRAVLH
ncbi:hypothetical protein [Alkalicoccus luteus]|uniref:hypothetical protein n=1 Tax=Alkalicoccus luteus TaxID=1237094 RepID=UPI004033B384